MCAFAIVPVLACACAWALTKQQWIIKALRMAVLTVSPFLSIWRFQCLLSHNHFVHKYINTCTPCATITVSRNLSVCIYSRLHVYTYITLICTVKKHNRESKSLDACEGNIPHWSINIITTPISTFFRNLIALRAHFDGELTCGYTKKIFFSDGADTIFRKGFHL